KVRDIVEEFGFAPKYGKEEILPNCSLALGGSETVTPLEMARAYSGFAARGRLPQVMPIRYVIDSSGNCRAFLPDIDEDECKADPPEYKSEQVVERNDADVANQVLTHVVQSGTATVANIGRPVAGKTGTTQDFESAWFAGYTPNLVTVVWEGYPVEQVKAPARSFVDGRRVPKSGKIAVVPRMTYCSDTRVCRPVHGYEVTGGGAPVSPAVIWANYMREATGDLDPLPFPIPTETPDEILNSPPPAPAPAPAPTETKEEEEEEPEEPQPTGQPTEEPEPQPTSEPTVIPTESPAGGGNGGSDGDGELAGLVIGTVAPLAYVCRRRRRERKRR
ncbi:MAG: penicillin-binding transpeptidase domain-containing protein, partial [Actinomycetota bacterium]